MSRTSLELLNVNSPASIYCRFQAMAVAAREEGILRYNVLAQLDNIAWALLRVGISNYTYQL
jgi:hypothetical protein